MRFLERLRWGARVGAIFGLLYASLAVVIFLVGGQAPFEAGHSSFEKMIATYLVGGVGAGLIVGMLKPLTQSKVGAAIVGSLAAIPVGILLRFATGHPGPWQGTDTVVTLLFCAMLGAPLGVAYRRGSLDDDVGT